MNTYALERLAEIRHQEVLETARRERLLRNRGATAPKTRRLRILSLAVLGSWLSPILRGS
jgi:hypothetical protein